MFALNRVVNLEDFQERVVRDTIREIFARQASESPAFPTGQEHRTQWENAMTVLALREGGALRPDAEVLGIGGSEATRFWLTNQVRRVWATDLYDKSGTSSDAAPSLLPANPRSAWDGPWNPRRLVVRHMDPRELLYEDGTFDGIFVSRSIERLGSSNRLAALIDEAFRVLKPGGTASFSTDLLIDGDPLPFEDERVIFTPELIQHVFVGERDWALVTPIDYTISAATLATEVEVADYLAPTEPTYPNCVLRMGSNLITSVHIAVRRSVRLAPRKVISPPGGPHPIAGPLPEVGRLADRLPDPVVAVHACSYVDFPRYFGADVLGERASVIGFEPDPEGYHRLCQRYAGRPNVTIVARALGSRRGSGSLRTDAELAEEWKQLAQPLVDADEARETGAAEFETIDDWCRDYGIDGVDLLKLDVPGRELDVLRGAAAQLANARAIEVQTWLNPVLTGAEVYGEVDSLLREHGFVLWRLTEQEHYKLAGSEDASWSIERILPSGHDPVEVELPSGPICRANAQYIRREIIAVGSHPSWADCLRHAVLMNALSIHDVALISLRRLLDEHPPEDVAAAVRRIYGVTPTVGVPVEAAQTEEGGGGEEGAPTDDTALRNGQSEAATSPIIPSSGLHRRRSLVQLLGSAARRPYHPVVWRLNRNYEHGLAGLDAIEARLDRLDAIEARLAAVERRLEELTRQEMDGREAIRSAERVIREIRMANDASREAIADWSAVIARELSRDRVDER
jgi:FkbM family methyltransferase